MKNIALITAALCCAVTVVAEPLPTSSVSAMLDAEKARLPDILERLQPSGAETADSSNLTPGLDAGDWLGTDSAVISNRKQTYELLRAVAVAGKDRIHPLLLVDLDGRSVLDIDAEDLGEEVKKLLRRLSCRIVEPAGIHLDFYSDFPVSVIEVPQSLVVTCPKDVKYRLVLLEDGVPVSAVRTKMVDVEGGRETLARVQFFVEDRTPLDQAVFRGDGQPHAIELNTFLFPVTGDRLVGEVEPLGDVQLRLIAD